MKSCNLIRRLGLTYSFLTLSFLIRVSSSLGNFFSVSFFRSRAFHQYARNLSRESYLGAKLYISVRHLSSLIIILHIQWDIFFMQL